MTAASSVTWTSGFWVSSARLGLTALTNMLSVSALASCLVSQFTRAMLRFLSHGAERPPIRPLSASQIDSIRVYFPAPLLKGMGSWRAAY